VTSAHVGFISEDGQETGRLGEEENREQEANAANSLRPNLQAVPA
jgi:hypothetical protein